MKNLSASLQKFMGNKNTVTIIGVILCIFILYFGYNYRINQKVKLVRIPYANQTIQPRTLITSDMIEYMEVPGSFLVGSYYDKVSDVIGRYSNYNTVIASGSIFYKELITDEANLPDSALQHVPDKYTVINYAVNMSTTYANSMYPGNYINIYFKGVNDDDKVMFGKFMSDIKILDVKDASGQKVFETTEEVRTPAFMLFAVPEDWHILIRKALYLSDYDVELILVPNTTTVDEQADVIVDSEDIKNFIEEKTQMVDITQLPSTSDSNATIPDDQQDNKNDNQ